MDSPPCISSSFLLSLSLSFSFSFFLSLCLYLSLSLRFLNLLLTPSLPSFFHSSTLSPSIFYYSSRHTQIHTHTHIHLLSHKHTHTHTHTNTFPKHICIHIRHVFTCQTSKECNLFPSIINCCLWDVCLPRCLHTCLHIKQRETPPKRGQGELKG